MHVTTVLVTHDQNEAMEVADWLLVLDHGRIAQAGSPTDLYDRPASEFVLRFLGPSTELDGVSVRPHDLVVVPAGQGTPARVREVATLGFEIRVALTLDDGQQLWVQLSRAEYQGLSLEVGERVGVRRRDGATTTGPDHTPAVGAPAAATPPERDVDAER